MASFKGRIEVLEKEYLFSEWLRCERFLDSLTDKQLEDLAVHGRLPEPLPGPLPQGASRVDGLDHKTLIKLWKDSELRMSQFHQRSHEDQEFFCLHGHWPGEACTLDCPEVRRQRGTAQ
ncbi:MAG TPA: hypothetical protein VN950_19155 [Terriglobales bacterium]|nr:hypothetical protein [Terriglobales bacterium]